MGKVKYDSAKKLVDKIERLEELIKWVECTDSNPIVMSTTYGITLNFSEQEMKDMLKREAIILRQEKEHAEIELRLL